MKTLSAIFAVLLLSIIGTAQIGYGTAKRIQYGTALPAVCSPATGDIFFLNTGNVGAYQCTAANTWIAMGAGGSGGAFGNITVASSYPNIQAALTAAGSTGSLLIPSNYVGTDTYSNSNGIQIIDLRGRPNRNRGFINVLVDCGLKGDGVTDDSTAANTCFTNFPGYGFFFPKTQANYTCSYFFSSSLIPKGDNTSLFGDASGFNNNGATSAGTALCFAAGVTGINLILTNTTGASIHDLNILGAEGTAFLTDSTKINFPAGDSLPQYSRAIASIQRTGNVLTVNTTAAGGQEGITQLVGSQVLISGVVGDATMNGRCIIATLTNLNSFGENPTGFTCAQNGADAGPFTTDGTLKLATSGTSTADGIRVCGNFFKIENVSIKAFGRHGINADAVAGHGCPNPFSDDLRTVNVDIANNQGDGLYCQGTDCNVQVHVSPTLYYNLLWGAEDQSALGNSWYTPQFSNNGAAWVGGGGATPATRAISTISRTLVSGVSTVTVVLSVANTSVKQGSCIVVAGVTDSSFNTAAGQCYFVTAYTDSTHFQWEQPGAPADASSSGGTVRMSKFIEAYLSAGVDSGAAKMATQSPSSSTILIGGYVEGGQLCKIHSYVISIGGPTGGCNVVTNTFKPSFFGVQGSGGGGFGGSLGSNISVITNDRNVNANLYLRAGLSPNARHFTLNWTKYDNTVGFQIDGDTTGTNGDNSQLQILRNGFFRAIFRGSVAGGGTLFGSESTAAIEFNTFNTSGTGGVKGGDGTGATTWTVSGAGLGTFNGGVIGATLRSQTANVAAAGTVRLAKTDTIAFRNNANGADVNGLSLDGSDVVQVGGTAGFKINGSQALNGVQGTTGTKVAAATGSFTSGNGVKTDIDGNFVDGGTPYGYATNFAYGGSGLDGPLAFDGVTTIPCASLAGSIYTLTRECYATTLVLSSGVTINTNNAGQCYIMQATTSVSVSGTIQSVGPAGSNAAGKNGGSSAGQQPCRGGASARIGTQSAGASTTAANGVSGGGGTGGVGGGGSTGANTVSSGSANYCPAGASGTGAAGGTGGAGVSAAGALGAGGTGGGTTPNTLANTINDGHTIWAWREPAGTQTFSTCYYGGGGGGSAGGGNGVQSGGDGGGSGAGGGGGGVVFLSSPIITVAASGVISANGGVGGNGANGTNGQAGGGATGGGGGGAGGTGGPGGFVVLVYHTYTNGGSVTANGGSGGTLGTKGTGTAGGANGSDGNTGLAGKAGVVFQFAN